MPYIPKDRRLAIGLSIKSMPQNVGELTFTLAALLNEYMKLKGLKYQTIAEILGALEGCKLDFQNQILHPYEETKAIMAGDVYDLSLFDVLNEEYNKWLEEHP